MERRQRCILLVRGRGSLLRPYGSAASSVSRQDGTVISPVQPPQPPLLSLQAFNILLSRLHCLSGLIERKGVIALFARRGNELYE
jgi:hypothetical protein